MVRHVAVLFLLWPAGASADATAWPGLPQVLRADDASVTATFPFADGERASLQLRVAVSELVDPEQSALTVELDGRPMFSRRLAAASRVDGLRTVQVHLGQPGPGFHAVRVRARLRTGPDERCTGDWRRERWIRIVHATVTRRRAGQDDDRGPPRSLAEWRALGAAARVQIPSRGGGWIAAYLEADHTLRSWGIEPVATASRALRLQVAPRLEAGVGGAFEVSGDDLTVTASTPEGLVSALALLRRGETEALCPRSACLLPGGGPPTPTASPPEPGPSVWTLRDAGHPEGWTARGPGEHVLRLAWSRPGHVEPRAWPQLDLPVRAGAMEGLDRARSHVEVRFGGRPLDAWPLEDIARAEHRLIARVPSELWTLRRWELSIHVRLVPGPELRCAAEADGGPWVVVGAAAALDVPRVWRGDAGLHRFAARPSLPLLSIRGAVGAEELRSLAAVTWPLKASRLGSPWRLRPEAAGRQLRIGVGRHLRPLRARGRTWLADGGGALGLPLVDAGDAAALECLDPSCEAVGVRPGRGASPPAWAELAGTAAVGLGARWTSAIPSGDALQRVGSAPREGEVATSHTAARLRWLDAASLATLLLFLALAAVWLWRARRAERRT